MNKEQLKQIIKEELKKVLIEAAVPPRSIPAAMPKAPSFMRSGEGESNLPTAQSKAGVISNLQQLAKALNGKTVNIDRVGSFPITAKQIIFKQQRPVMMGGGTIEKPSVEITVLTSNNKNLVLRLEVSGYESVKSNISLETVTYGGNPVQNNNASEYLGDGRVGPTWANEVLEGIKKVMARGFIREMRPQQ